MTKCWKEQKQQIVFALKREKEKMGKKWGKKGRKEKGGKGDRKMLGWYVIKGTWQKDFE